MSQKNGRWEGDVFLGATLGRGYVPVNALKLWYQLPPPLFTLHFSSHGKELAKKQLLQLKKLRNSPPLKVVTGFLLVILTTYHIPTCLQSFTAAVICICRSTLEFIGISYGTRLQQRGKEGQGRRGKIDDTYCWGDVTSVLHLGNGTGD